MKKKIFLPLIIISFICSTSPVFGWGVWGHTHINKGAVLALPQEMGLFFYNHSDFITEESTIPDLRKHTLGDKAEFCRHYVNLESYHYHSRTDMPETLPDAVTKYGKDTLDKNGILPWYIQNMMVKLTDAFKNRRKTEILFLASDLGHYIADAHMPLHTTVNHNGQLTGQDGIHAFWEAQLPELFGRNYDLYTGDAHYINNVEQAIWDMIDSSHNLVNSLLGADKKLKNDYPEDKQYVMGADGKPLKNKFGNLVHTNEYALVYHTLLNGMVEHQMRQALRRTADLWYTAWVNAGKPDLSDLDPDYVTKRNKTFYNEDVKAWKKGKVRGCSSDKEF